MCVLFALWFALRGFQKGNDTPAPVRSAQEELGLLGNTQSPSSAIASTGLRTSLHSSGGFSQLEAGQKRAAASAESCSLPEDAVTEREPGADGTQHPHAAGCSPEDGTRTSPQGAAVPPARGFVAVGRGTASSNSPPGLVGVFVLAVRL